MATQTLPRRVGHSWAENTSNEAEYIIERKDCANGVFKIIDYTSSNAVSYIDATEIAGVSFSYRISA